tara:strand:+ start:141 stop:1067 length:927 start_codon:yes stop_codon:yes gene_type:complete
MVRSFRDSGEFRESTGFGAAGQGGGDTRQRRSTRQDAVDLANDMDTSKYSGNLRDAIQRKNIDIKNNQRRVAERIAEDPTRAGFRGFLPSRTDIDAFKGSFGRGLDALKSTLTPGRIIASGIGSALFGPVGGILAGLLANQRTVDAAKKDFRDTIDFFTPQQVEQPMMTNMPMKRPMQMFPIQSVTDTTGMPFMDQIPDMFPDNEGVPSYTPFGMDSLMQPKENETFTMPERNRFMDYGTMPRVTSAPFGVSSTPINAVDLFGNPVVSGVSTFDPSVEVIDLGTADREIKPGTFSDNLSFQDIVNILK